MAASAESNTTAAQPASLVDKDTRAYFIHLRQILRGANFDDTNAIDRFGELDGFLEMNDPEQREILLLNAFVEVRGKEGKLCLDPRCSVALEDLMRATLIASGSSPLSPLAKRIAEFFSRLAGKYLFLAMDPFGSRVLESALVCLHSILHTTIAMQKKGEIDSAKPPIDIESLILDFCRELEEHWTKLLSDRNASFLIRVLFRLLAGCIVVKEPAKPSSMGSTSVNRLESRYDPNNNHNNNNNNNNNGNEKDKSEKDGDDLKAKETRKMPFSFKTALQHMVMMITGSLSDNNVAGLVFHVTAGPSLAVLMSVLQYSHKSPLGQLAKRILKIQSPKKKHKKKKSKKKKKKDNIEEEKMTKEYEDQVDLMLKDRIGSLVLEQMIKVVKPNLFVSIANRKCIKDNLVDLAQHHTANFIVQRIAERAADLNCDSVISMIIDALAPNLSLFADRPGVILQLVGLGLKNTELQTTLFESIQKSMKEEGTPLAKSLLMLHGKTSTWRRRAPRPSPFSVLGSLITKELLNYSSDIVKPLIDSFGDIQTDDLVSAATNPNASRAIEHFLQGNFFEAQMKLITNLKGHFSDLAKDKYGSHCIEKCFAITPLAKKEEIVSELAKSYQTLQREKYANFVLRNCKVQQYLQQKDIWKQEQIKMERKRKVFLELVEEDEKLKKKTESVRQERARHLQTATTTTTTTTTTKHDDRKQTKKRKKEAIAKEDVDDDDDDEENETKDAAMMEIERVFSAKQPEKKKTKTKRAEKKAKKNKDKEEEEDSGASNSLDFVFKAIADTKKADKSSSSSSSTTDVKKKKKKTKTK
eukprot:TRINITY_DN612_c0_g3_i1.p1 TRINITY_DN612_c0_g3~~TRINITY_DN612_c0_g3_i1.p1  ORF type:complete len:812 (+),score=299.29 TRINITY_DN612_c0_g3_i1:55-2490(+)